MGNIKVVFNIPLWTTSLLLWAWLAYHYATRLLAYNSIDGFWLRHSNIYIAVESWFLVCLVMLVISAYMLVLYARKFFRWRERQRS